MVKMWLVIILFFLGGAIGFLGWLTGFSTYYDFSYNAKVAQAESAMKSQRPGSARERFGETRFSYMLKFKNASGSDLVTQAYVPTRLIEKLDAGEPIKIYYLPKTPDELLFEGDVQKIYVNYTALLLGLLSIIVGVALIWRRHHFAKYTRFLGHGDAADVSGS